MGNLYPLSEVARLLDIEAKTLRYYESCGIMKSVGKDESTGESLYDQQSIHVLWQDLVMRDAGLSIGDLQKLERGEGIDEMIAEMQRRLCAVRSSLAMLKQIGRKEEHKENGRENRYLVKETRIPAGHYLCHKFVAPTGSDLFDSIIKLFGKAANLGLEPDRSRPPLCLFPDIEFHVTDIPCETYLPVIGGTKEQGVVWMDTIPVISTVHHGSYRDMEYAYNALEDYINEHDLEVIGSPMESYVFAYNDPKRKYLSTTLYYPIAKY